MIDLNVTLGHKTHLGLYTIIREILQGSSDLDSIVKESLHHFPFAILSDNCDNLVLE